MITKKKMLTALLAATMTMSLAVPALAAEPTEEEKQANADTTINIYETTIDPANVSFEVPLYVTMAVVNEQTDVVVPDNYGIKNTTPQDTKEEDVAIAVTGMSFTKLDGSTYNTVANTAAKDTDIKLTIGGITMPELSAPGTKSVNIKGASNELHNGTNYTKIDANQTLPLTLTGTVKSATRNNKKAAAQFRVNYVVSALDSTGKPIGMPYAGNDSELAGLGTWSDTTDTWE